MRPILSFALLLAGACGYDGACEGHPTSISLTPGDDRALLVDGDRLAIINGPQGGWHIEVGVRVADPNPEVLVALSVDALGARTVDQSYELRLRDHDGCEGWRGGLLGIFDLSRVPPGEGTPGDRLRDQALVVTASVVGSRGEASATVRALGGEGQ